MLPGKPLNPPLVASSTFRFADAEETLRAVKGEGYIYSRWDNPTIRALEEDLARLIGAERALTFGSGMAAVSNALLCALRDTPRLLCQREAYGGSVEVARDLLPRWGIDVTFFGADDWRDAFQDGATYGAVYAEAPTNPTLRLIDLPALAEAAHAAGALLLVDNTFATPLGQRPLELGADVVVHSASKYMGGHHDLLAGVVAGSEAFCKQLWSYRKLLGAVLDPFPGNLLARGLKTLEVRVQRQSETALALGQWLEEQPWAERVLYPWLPSHPDHELARTQLRMGGGMLCFEARGGYEAAVRLTDRLQAFALAPSLGGTESLATLPKTTSHVNLSDDELQAAGIAPGLIRLSIGLEPVDALRADLEQAASQDGARRIH